MKDKLRRAKDKLSKMKWGSSQYYDQSNRIAHYEKTGNFAMGEKTRRK